MFAIKVPSLACEPSCTQLATHTCRGHDAVQKIYLSLNRSVGGAVSHRQTRCKLRAHTLTRGAAPTRTSAPETRAARTAACGPGMRDSLSLEESGRLAHSEVDRAGRALARRRHGAGLDLG